MRAGGVCAADKLPGDYTDAELLRGGCRDRIGWRSTRLVPAKHRRSALVPWRDPDLQT